MIPPGRHSPGVASPIGSQPDGGVAGGPRTTRKTSRGSEASLLIVDSPEWLARWRFKPDDATRAIRFVMYRKWHMPARPPRHVGNCLHVDPRVAWLLAERAA